MLVEGEDLVWNVFSLQGLPALPSIDVGTYMHFQHVVRVSVANSAQEGTCFDQELLENDQPPAQGLTQSRFTPQL